MTCSGDEFFETNATETNVLALQLKRTDAKFSRTFLRPNPWKSAWKGNFLLEKGLTKPPCFVKVKQPLYCLTKLVYQDVNVRLCWFFVQETRSKIPKSIIIELQKLL